MTTQSEEQGMPVFNRERGSSYADPVQFVAYFRAGQAVRYFPRYSYGWPQSLGCVELPLDAAARARPYLTYGSLLTVRPLEGLYLSVTPRVYTFRSRRGKISSGWSLAHRAFGVWITPLSFSRRPPGRPPAAGLRLPWR
jgi:hypothetical protein